MITLLDLPNELLQLVVETFSLQNLCYLRLVCRRFVMVVDFVLQTRRSLDLASIRDEYHEEACKHCPNVWSVKVPADLTTRTAEYLGQYCKQLRCLILDGCSTVTDACLEPLANCAHLEQLGLLGCEAVTLDGLRNVLEHCPLQRLDIAIKAATDLWLMEISRLCASTLKQFSCDDVAITDIGLAAISSSCVNLESISVMNCFQVSDASIGLIAQQHPRLTELEMYVGAVSDETMDILSHCTNLERLILNAENLTDAGVRAVACNCIQLQLLELHSASELRNSSILYIAHHLSLLRTLSLNLLHRCTEQCMLLVSQCENLTELSLQESAVTDDWLFYLFNGHTRMLQSLRLSNNYDITDSGVSTVFLDCPRLAALALDGTAITAATLRRASRCSTLRVLYLSGDIHDGNAEAALKKQGCIVQWD